MLAFPCLRMEWIAIRTFKGENQEIAEERKNDLLKATIVWYDLFHWKYTRLSECYLKLYLLKGMKNKLN